MRVLTVEELETIDCLPCRIALATAVGRDKGWLPPALAAKRRTWLLAARAAGIPPVLLAARAALTSGRISQLLARAATYRDDDKP